MYDNLDPLEKYHKFTQEVIQVDRQKFVPIVELALDFLSNNHVNIIFGKHAVQYIVDQKIDLTNFDYPMIIFSPKPYDYARELCRQIYEKTKEELISASAKDDGQSVMVSYRIRNMFEFRLVEKYAGQSLIELIVPLMIPWKTGQVACSSPEILLIDLYRKLILPSYYDDREDLEKQEKVLYKYWSDRLSKEVSGGFDYYSGEMVSLKRSILDKLYEEVMDTVIIGRNAIENDPKLILLHVVSRVPIEKIEEIVTGLTDKEISIATHGLNLPVDTRLERIRVNIRHNDVNYQVIDIFTAPTYDLMCNHPYMWLRFIFADLWSLKLLFKTGKINEEKTKKQALIFINLIRAAHSKINSFSAMYNDPQKYFGSYLSDAKARILQGSKFTGTFYPCLKKDKTA